MSAAATTTSHKKHHSIARDLASSTATTAVAAQIVGARAAVATTARSAACATGACNVWRVPAASTSEDVEHFAFGDGDRSTRESAGSTEVSGPCRASSTSTPQRNGERPHPHRNSERRAAWPRKRLRTRRCRTLWNIRRHIGRDVQRSRNIHRHLVQIRDIPCGTIHRWRPQKYIGLLRADHLNRRALAQVTAREALLFAPCGEGALLCRDGGASRRLLRASNAQKQVHAQRSRLNKGDPRNAAPLHCGLGPRATFEKGIDHDHRALVSWAILWRNQRESRRQLIARTCAMTDR